MGEGDGGRWSKEKMNCVTVVAAAVVVRSNRKRPKKTKPKKNQKQSCDGLGPRSSGD